MIIKFCELLLRISPRIINSLRSYIKHSKECFLLFPNTSKLVKKKSAAPRFSNLLLGVWKSEETLVRVFDLLLKKNSSSVCSRSPQNLEFVHFSLLTGILSGGGDDDVNENVDQKTIVLIRKILALHVHGNNGVQE